MSQTKPKQVRLYLPGEEAAVVEKLAKDMNQPESWVATTLLAEALKAVEQNGGWFPMPFALQIHGTRTKKAAA